MCLFSSSMYGTSDNNRFDLSMLNIWINFEALVFSLVNGYIFLLLGMHEALYLDTKHFTFHFLKCKIFFYNNR